MAAHTPGPWHYLEEGQVIRVHYSMPDGRESGSTVTIGSTALQFRAPRQGSHRGQTMVYRPFADHDRANARLIAAAPDLYAAIKESMQYLDQTIGPCDEGCECILHGLHAAIAKAEGRS